MRAAVIYAAKQPLVVEELTLDDPRRHEVRVKLQAAGVCHSDYHVVDGSWHGKDFPLPMVLGHEAAGVVDAVGPEVTRVKPGDHVILSFTVSCGQCRYCVNGQASLCNGLDSPVGTMPDGTRRIRKGNKEVNIFGRMGGFAERVIVHESQAIPMRPEMPFDRAVLIGCATMTGIGAVLNTAKVETGATVAVFGTGGVGLNVIQGAALVNASKIIAVDLLDNKLEIARMMGATHTINSRKDDPIQAIREIADGGVDYAFDAIGLPTVSRQAYDAARRGGTAVVVGMAPTGAEISIPGSIPGDAKTLKGCFYGSTRPAIDFPRLVDLYLQGRLKLDQLVTRQYALDEINEAFAALARGDNARGVVIF